jgi:hypothetical protein
LICSYCSHDNPDNFYFCGACGKPVRGAASRLEPAAPSEPRSADPTSSAIAPQSGESRAGLSTIDPDLYPRRAGEVPQPIRLPSGYRSALLGMAPESDEPGYSYLLEEDRPSRWRFLVTAIILFTLGGLAYWQISLHGGFSGTLNAFRNAQQQDQQRRADASHQAGPANDSDAKPSDESAATARKEAPTPGQAAPAGAAKAPPPDNQSTRAAVAPKEAAEPAATPSTQETSAAVPAKSAAEATQPASLRQSEPAAPAVDENTRLAEKYLYGEGVPQDCSRAVGLIKPAASSANPKAQSMLGTMYATGHCVPRDLPTSYRYFALALRQEPRNQWVEKDMEMVWNQMNPSEKQLATRLAK